MTIESQIEKRHFAEVPLELTETDTQTIFGVFDELLSLPLEYRTAGNYAIPNKPTGGFGYRRRVAGRASGGRDTSTDTKHVYHFGSHTRQAFEGSGWQRTPHEVRKFCDAAEHLYWLGVATLRQTVELMKEEQWFKNPGTPSLWPLFYDGFNFLDMHLRLNAYESPVQGQPYLGQRHVDRSTLTLGLISSPGIEFGLESDGSDARPFEPSIGNAQLFAGGSWSLLPTEYRDAYSYMHPAVHGVRKTEADLSSSVGTIVGHSAVLFANPWGMANDLTPAETKPSVLKTAV